MLGVSFVSGILKDDQSLKEAKVTSGIKIMVVGTTLEGLLSVQQPKLSDLKKSAAEEAGINYFSVNNYRF